MSLMVRYCEEHEGAWAISSRKGCPVCGSPGKTADAIALLNERKPKRGTFDTALGPDDPTPSAPVAKAEVVDVPVPSPKAKAARKPPAKPKRKQLPVAR